NIRNKNILPQLIQVIAMPILCYMLSFRPVLLHKRVKWKLKRNLKQQQSSIKLLQAKSKKNLEIEDTDTSKPLKQETIHIKSPIDDSYHALPGDENDNKTPPVIPLTPNHLNDNLQQTNKIDDTTSNNIGLTK